jgi:hypothetical protein
LKIKAGCYCGAKLFNRLPNNIKETKDINSFQNLTKDLIWEKIPSYETNFDYLYILKVLQTLKTLLFKYSNNKTISIPCWGRRLTNFINFSPSFLSTYVDYVAHFVSHAILDRLRSQRRDTNPLRDYGLRTQNKLEMQISSKSTINQS